MSRRFTVAESIFIALPAELIYPHISDPTQTARWSPENTGAQGSAGRATGGLRVGDSFIGRNTRNGFRWSTECTVTAAEPNRRFAFRVHKIGLGTPRLSAPNASWEYVLAPLPGGTQVTEIWTDDRVKWPTWAAAIFDRIVTRKKSFAEFNGRNIHITLANLKATLEREHAA